MKRILLTLAAMATAIPAFAADPVKAAPLHAEFSKAPPYMQNRVCGELMIRMARLSANLYVQTGFAGVKDAAVLAGTRAMTFMEANASMSADEEKRATDIADQLEKGLSPAHPVLAEDKYCEERAQRWLKEGVVSQAQVDATEKQVRATVDKLVPVKHDSLPASAK